MTPKEKITALRKVLTAALMARMLGVSKPAVDSWTKKGKGAREPDPDNVEKIDKLYDKLQPCIDALGIK